MITIIIRVILIYVLVLCVFRLMGKRQIGQMQPFELVLTLIIADLATIPMAEITVPALNGIVPLLTLVVIHFLITVVTKKSNVFSKIISGQPIIIVNQDGIDYRALKKLNITIDDLLEAIRDKGFFDINEVLYVIMETNGTVSVLPKIENAPLTVGDSGLEKSEASLNVNIIVDGAYNNENIKLTNLDKSYFDNLLKKQNIKKVKDVLLLCINKDGQVYLQEKYKNGKCIQTNQKQVTKL